MLHWGVLGVEAQFDTVYVPSLATGCLYGKGKAIEGFNVMIADGASKYHVNVAYKK